MLLNCLLPDKGLAKSCSCSGLILGKAGAARLVVVSLHILVASVVGMVG